MRFSLSLILYMVFVCTAVAGAESPRVDSILIEKSAHRMVLMSHGKPVKAYRVTVGRGGKGPKVEMGDRKTPEGHYVISGRNSNSKFHRALRISYPNAEDIKRARKLGKSPGGDIMIHGLPEKYFWLSKSHLLWDWTTGCVAVTNDEIDEIWNLVADGTPVDIKP